MAEINVVLIRPTFNEADDIPGVTCYCYFGGRDDRGTCNKGCQWWRDSNLDKKGKPRKRGCPMWIPQEKWNTKEDPFKKTQQKGTGDAVDLSDRNPDSANNSGANPQVF